jgi:Ca-activated chloride channel homolog
LTSGWTKGSLQIPRGLRRVGLLAIATNLPSLFVAAQEPAPPTTAQTIHVNVDRINVGVVVTDSKGKFVQGLQRENFQILDNGKAQPITEFASIDAPARLVMVVEAGPAVYLLQDSHLFVADTLLNGLALGDSVAIASYNENPTPILNFTNDKRLAQGALDQIQFNLGYAALNLSSSLNTILDWLVAVPGKKTIVLVSTGVDTSATPVMQALLTRLQTSDVQILAVSMAGALRNVKDADKRKFAQTMQVFAEADTWLTALAQATGGRAWFPENAKAFQETYKQIAEIVRHEYSLAFAPPIADGAIHALGVKIKTDPSPQGTPEKSPDYRIDHRKAYQAPEHQ